MSHKTRPQTRPGKARPDIAWLPHLAKSSQPSGARLAAAYYRITARASVTTLAIETFEMDEQQVCTLLVEATRLSRHDEHDALHARLA
jgi:hypothetical protein